MKRKMRDRHLTLAISERGAVAGLVSLRRYNDSKLARVEDLHIDALASPPAPTSTMPTEVPVQAKPDARPVSPVVASDKPGSSHKVAPVDAEAVRQLLTCGSHTVGQAAVAHNLTVNYVMKLMRRELRGSTGLELRAPVVMEIAEGTFVHVVFDANERPLLTKYELCRLMGVKGTTFNYWARQADLRGINTNDDFRLMDSCRRVFGGRASYRLYRPESLEPVLALMGKSRQTSSQYNIPIVRRTVQLCCSTFPGLNATTADS